MEKAATIHAARGTDAVRDELEYQHHPCTGDALDALQRTWGAEYEIGCDDGEWWFRRRDGIGGRETAPTPDELHAMIVENYNFRPVRRDDAR